MARKNLKVRICDQCGKEQVSQGAFGGNAFQGWLHVNKDISPVVTPAGGIKEDIKTDFCCDKCLGKYIAEMMEEINA